MSVLVTENDFHHSFLKVKISLSRKAFTETKKIPQQATKSYSVQTETRGIFRALRIDDPTSNQEFTPHKFFRCRTHD